MAGAARQEWRTTADGSLAAEVPSGAVRQRLENPPGMRTWRREGRIPILKTDRAKAVRSYQRLGFAILTGARVLGVSTWFMSRLPSREKSISALLKPGIESSPFFSWLMDHTSSRPGTGLFSL